MISLTGDVSTGKKVLEAASHSIKKTHLELGGKAPVIVFDDADICDDLTSGSFVLANYCPDHDCDGLCDDGDPSPNGEITLSFNGDDYVPKSAVPEIINSAAKRGASEGKSQALGALKNSRSQRSKVGI